MYLIVYRNATTKKVYHVYDRSIGGKYTGSWDTLHIPESGWELTGPTSEIIGIPNPNKPKMNMKYPTPDLYDRYTIECLKRDRAGANNSSHIIALSNEIDDRNRNEDFIARLYEVNGQIWDLESDIRKGKEAELGLEEVGRRALAIRNINRQRIFIKDEIAQAFGEYGEKKYNHASE